MTEESFRVDASSRPTVTLLAVLETFWFLLLDDALEWLPGRVSRLNDLQKLLLGSCSWFSCRIGTLPNTLNSLSTRHIGSSCALAG